QLSAALLDRAGLRSVARARDAGQASGHRFTRAEVNRFFAEALEAVKRAPGVESAAFTSELPLSGEGQLEIYNATFERDGGQKVANAAFRYAVTPGYFETMGIPLRRGRIFEASDLNQTAVRPVIINESFA